MTAITLATASCSWLESLDKDPTADWSADKLYTEARAALEESNWTDAKDYYTKLEARYPFGTYAQQAQIELIYANWKDGDAAQAVQGADRFLQAYPNHANSDYVMYLKALATLNENDGWFAKLAAQDLAERDANAAQEAFDILKELALRFPDSRYAPEARRRMHQLVLAQAKHELGVAEYYYVRHAYVAAIQQHPPRVRRIKPGQQVEHGGLARAVGAGYARKLARGGGKANAVHRAQAAERFGKIQRLKRHVSSPWS